MLQAFLQPRSHFLVTRGRETRGLSQAVIGYNTKLGRTRKLFLVKESSKKTFMEEDKMPDLRHSGLTAFDPHADDNDFSVSPEEVKRPSPEVTREFKRMSSPMLAVTPPTNSSTDFTTQMMAHLPGTLLNASAAYQTYDKHTRFTVYTAQAELMQCNSIQELSDWLNQSTFLWLDACSPSITDLYSLAQMLSIHPLTIEDIQTEDPREKCETYARYVFTCARTATSRYYHKSFSSEIGDEDSSCLYMVLFNEKQLLTIHAQPMPHIRDALKRIDALRTASELTADWILYALLDTVVDEFVPGIKLLEQEVDSIDDLVLVLRSTDQADMLRRIGVARRRVVRLARLLKPKGEVLRVLYKRCPERLHPTTLLYLRDINDHLQSMLQSLEQAAMTLDRSHSNYLASINIELAEASNRMNFVVKKLTAAASLVLPLSLISGIWGMNVAVPGQPGTGWMDYGPFAIIIGAMIVLMSGMFLYGRHYDWF